MHVFLAIYARANTGEVVFHGRTFPIARMDWVTLLMDAAPVEDSACRTLLFVHLPNCPGDETYSCLGAPQGRTRPSAVEP